MANKKKYLGQKIIVISPLGYTGLAYYDYSLCQSLSKLGINIELCTSDQWILSSYKNTFKLTYIYKRCSGNVSKIIKGFNYFKASVNVLIHAICIKASIVHFQIIEIPAIDLCLMAVLKLCGKKVVYTPHDIGHNKNFPLNKIIISYIYLIVDRIIVHKKANLDTIVKEFGINTKKIFIVSHGGYEYFVNYSITKMEARIKLGYSQDHKILLFFGNIKPDKGLEILIKSLPLLRKEIQNLKLLIAGKVCGGIKEDAVRNIIEKEGVSDLVNINFGFIPVEKIEYFYMASDIVVLPYRKVSESGVVRFAQTCGKAVLCSDLEEFKDTVFHGKTGYLFNNGDHTDLALQIKTALSHEQYLQVGENAKRLMKEHYSWNEIGVVMANIYREILKNS